MTNTINTNTPIIFSFSRLVLSACSLGLFSRIVLSDCSLGLFSRCTRTGTLRLSSNYNMKELMRSRQIRLQDHQKAEAQQKKNKRSATGASATGATMVPGGNTAKAVAIGIGVLKIFNPPAIVKQCAEAVAERVKRVVRKWCLMFVVHCCVSLWFTCGSLWFTVVHCGSLWCLTVVSHCGSL